MYRLIREIAGQYIGYEAVLIIFWALGGSICPDVVFFFMCCNCHILGVNFANFPIFTRNFKIWP